MQRGGRVGKQWRMAYSCTWPGASRLGDDKLCALVTCALQAVNVTSHPATSRRVLADVLEQAQPLLERTIVVVAHFGDRVVESVLLGKSAQIGTLLYT